MSFHILPPDSPLLARFVELVESADLVFFAGLPGVGKSLLLQQLALLAQDSGRRVHLLQWDVARHPFEGPRYPLNAGATHPLVIRAVGIWARGAVLDWRAGGAGDMLIGELPLIGGRLMELARPHEDAAEALLRDERTRFVLPLPSRELRAAIEAKREATIAKPRHANEAHDAPPDLLRALWEDVHGLAHRLGMAESAQAAAYSPEIYAAVYARLLSERRCEVLPLSRMLPTAGSVYSGLDALPNLRATPEEAQRILARLEAQPQADARAWHKL